MIKTIGTLPACRTQLLTLLTRHPEGMILQQIIKESGLSARTIKNNLTFLKAEKSVIHNSPIWSIGTVESTPIELEYRRDCSNKIAPPSSNINLHNLSFLIKLIKKPYWWNQRNNKLLKLKDQHIKAIDTGRYTYSQMTKPDYAVQFHKESMIVIIRKVYRGSDAYDCLIQGIHDFLDIYAYISNLFQFRFFEDGIPQAMIRSQHTAKLYDAVAKRCKREGDKFEVWHEGKLRMYIDKSHPTGIEAIQREYSTEDIDRYLRYVEDIIHNNPPTPTEQAAYISDFLKGQGAYMSDIQLHVGAIKCLSSQVGQLSGQMEKFNDLLERFTDLLEKKR